MFKVEVPLTAETGRACPAGQNMHIGCGTVDATVPIIYGIIMQLRI